MTFREKLNKVKEMNISVCDLTIANECDCVFDFEYTEQQFEDLCELAKICYLKSEFIDICAIANVINDMIKDGSTIDDVLDMSKWDILNKAAYYM